MSIKISTVALYFFLHAYLVDARIREVEQNRILQEFFASPYIKYDKNFRVTNLIGDIKSVEKGTLDETCRLLQLRRLLQLYPLVTANDENTTFGDFFEEPGALGLDSIKKYDQRVPSENWEIGQFEYLLLPVHGTPFTKEIYHVPSLIHVDAAGDLYWVDDGYFALDDINDKGRPLIFEIIKNNRALLIAYEDTLYFSFP